MFVVASVIDCGASEIFDDFLPEALFPESEDLSV